MFYVLALILHKYLNLSVGPGLIRPVDSGTHWIGSSLRQVLEDTYSDGSKYTVLGVLCVLELQQILKDDTGTMFSFLQRAFYSVDRVVNEGRRSSYRSKSYTLQKEVTF